MSILEVKVPDIGEFKDIPVIEVLVKPGDAVKAEQSLITLESDKATLDVPSPASGVVKDMRVSAGAKVSEGSPILSLETDGAESAATQPRAASAESPAAAPPSASPSAPRSAGSDGAAKPAAAPRDATTTTATAAPDAVSSPAEASRTFAKAHASPSVRAFARELGVDVSRVKGTGPKDRILREDVQGFVKAILSGAAAPAGRGASMSALELLPWPKVDFARFGPVEAKPLSRIKKISGANLHRNWVMIPHVTNHDDADITELEAFRVRVNRENDKAGPKVTMLAFLIKACVAALNKFPDFNASLISGPEGESLIVKRYYHIGFAADTPNGLVVPVIKNADQKGILDIAREMAELSAKARDGKLAPGDMQGGTFSISSLGGIGGTYFTPIINAPELAILGVCRSNMRPVWDGKAFVPRLILPLSLSWDHRVIDGAAAARFNAYLIALLGDLRRTLL